MKKIYHIKDDMHKKVYPEDTKIKMEKNKDLQMFHTMLTQEFNLKKI